MSKTATWGKQKLNSSASKQQEQGCLLRRKESGALPAQAQSSHGAQPQLPEQGREPGTDSIRSQGTPDKGKELYLRLTQEKMRRKTSTGRAFIRHDQGLS